MNIAHVVKTSQEQALAAWIDSVNQMRTDALMTKLMSQDVNLAQALTELQKTKADIGALIVNNRGGTKGMHGFIAEAAEVGIENARNLIKGLEPACAWINNNGPADLLQNGNEIQQKFVKAGGHFGLEAVKAHFEKYPDFIKNGGKYQIPKDFYDQLHKLLSLPQEEAAKTSTSTYQNWKWVHSFFTENRINPKDLEPAVLDYSAVQTNKIYTTLTNEEHRIKNEDQLRRNEAYEASKPTLKQGAQIAAFSSLAEGGLEFCLSVARKRKQGKFLSEFTANDWKEAGIDSAKGMSKGGIRGAAIYTMTNFTATPAAVANALVTASFGVVAQASKLRQGTITTEDFIINSEVLCLDVSVSAVSSLLGQILIPFPYLGAVIGNVAGNFMYQIAKDHLSAKEQALIQHYRENFAALNKILEKSYQQLTTQLKNELAKFTSMSELAFDPDINIAFDSSIALANYVGIGKNQILRTKSDIDNYFMS